MNIENEFDEANESVDSRFDTVSNVEYGLDQDRKRLLTLEVNELYHRCITSNEIKIEDRDFFSSSPEDTKRVLAVIVESSQDLTKQLRLNKTVLIPTGEIHIGKDRRRAVTKIQPGRNLHIYFDINILLLHFVNLRSNRPEAGKANSRNDIRKVFGHEFYHFRLMDLFPGQHRITLDANKAGKHEAYLKDRGEHLADVFGEKYAIYKSKHETSPDTCYK